MDLSSFTPYMIEIFNTYTSPSPAQYPLLSHSSEGPNQLPPNYKQCPCLSLYFLWENSARKICKCRISWATLIRTLTSPLRYLNLNLNVPFYEGFCFDASIFAFAGESASHWFRVQSQLQSQSQLPRRHFLGQSGASFSLSHFTSIDRHRLMCNFCRFVVGR